MRDVVIPAGGTIDGEYARRIGTAFRALAPFGPNKTSALQIVVNALRESGHVRKIVCTAPQEVWGRVSHVDTWLAAGAHGPANILRGLAQLDNADAPAFVCASDLPLVTVLDITQFAEECDGAFDLTAGVIGADDYNNTFTDAPPSQFVVLKDAGPVTTSGLFGVRPSALLRNETRLTQVFDGRKSQARMASLLGPRLLWQWLTGTLTLAAIAARAERILGCRVQVVDTVAPALACDMDTADDYTYASQIYAARLVS